MSLYIPRMRHDDDISEDSHLPQPSYAYAYPHAASSLASLRRFPSSSRSSPGSASEHFMSPGRPYVLDEISEAPCTAAPPTPPHADYTPPRAQSPTAASEAASRKHTTLKKTRRLSQDSIDEKKRTADDAFWADLARQSNAFKGRTGASYASRIPTREEIFPSEPMPASWVRSFGPPPSLPVPREQTTPRNDWDEFEGPLFPTVREEVNVVPEQEEVPTCTQAIVRRVAALAQRLRYGFYNKQQAFSDWLSRRKVGLRCKRPPGLPYT